MFEHIIRFSVRNKGAVAIGVIALVVWGVVSFGNLPIDAVPDITNNQVQIITTSPSLAAEDVERLITAPVERIMASIPGQVELRSISRFGLSVVTIVFRDDIDLYWARAQVDQRLADIGEEIPQGTGKPMLAPITTGLGEIFQYTLHVDPHYAGNYTLTQLRTIQDWTVRRRLLGTQGVADVSSFGGYVRQVNIGVDPVRLASFGLSIADVVQTIERNNGNAGSSFIERNGRATFIRTEGLLHSSSDIALLPLPVKGASIPVTLGDVATIDEGHAVRYGALTVDGHGEAVGGIVMMLKGANSSQVIHAVKERVRAIEQELPPGVSIQPFLDRTTLVDKAIATVRTNLTEGALIVIFVLVLMLGNLRAGLIVASVIPLAMLFAIGMMSAFGVSGNLMSLGAIDFGLIVDGAVIIVENVLHHLGPLRGTAAEASITSSAVSIRRSAAFGEVIILIVYLPILALTGIEGKMFAPMAQTVMFAIIGAFILSTTYVPMMSALLLRKGVSTKAGLATRIMAIVEQLYKPVQRLTLRNPAVTLVTAVTALAIAVFTFLQMGGEFLPQLDEGDFAIETRLPTGSSLQATIDVAREASTILMRRFPEVRSVVAKIGTSEIPLDPMPVEACDLIVVLNDKRTWTTAHNRVELADTMERALKSIPGVSFGFQQPIQMRFNELMTGARQDVVIKIYGDDLDTLAALAHTLGDLLRTIDGAQDVAVEPIGGLPQTVVRIDRQAAATLGVSVADINAAITSSNAGIPAGVVIEGDKRFDIMVRHASGAWNPDRIMVPTNTGTLVPIRHVATIDDRVGPNQIQRDATRRRITVGFNVRGRDVASIVADASAAMSKSLPLPTGYTTHIGGQFENLNAATARLSIAVPVALLLIVLMLLATFRSILDAIMVFSAIPFAAIGGVAALASRSMPFSISAGVGFIALFGVAVLNGIVLISSFNAIRKRGVHNTLRVVMEGTSQRLRPVMMTALVASLGFLPMATSTGDGAEVQRPLATVVIGGLVTSTLLTLVVLPLLYILVHRGRGLRTNAAAAVAISIAALVPSMAYAQRAITDDEAARLALRHSTVAIDARYNVRQLRSMESAAFDAGRTSVTLMRGQYNTAAIDNNITITQTLPFPTVWFADAQAAARRTAQSMADSAALARRIERDARDLWHRIVAYRTMVSVLDSHRLVLERALDGARQRVRAGDAPTMDVQLLTTDVASLSARTAAVSAMRSQAEAQLSALCGGQEFVTAVGVDQRPLSTMTVDEGTWMERPRAAVAVAEGTLQAEQQRWLPDISLGWFTQTIIGPQTLGGVERTYTASDWFNGVIVGVQVPLWFVPQQARTERARLDVLRYQDLERTTKDAVRRLYEGHMERLRAQRSVVDMLEQTTLPTTTALMQAARTAWQQGELGYIEYYAAASRHVQARLDYAQAILDLNLLILETPTLGDL